jgi:uncharacterized membrane protein YeaQ/YmgE (transglycosylase-associated protein family)
MFGSGLLYIIIVGLIAGWGDRENYEGRGLRCSGGHPARNCRRNHWKQNFSNAGIFTTGGLIPSILVAIFGAVILVAIVRAIKKA